MTGESDGMTQVRGGTADIVGEAELPGTAFGDGDGLLQAVNGNVAAVDPAGAGGHEEGNDVGNLLRAAQAAHREAVADVGLELVGLLPADAVPPATLEEYGAGRHGVDAYVVVDELEGESLG
jgi:hypothetical protein